MPPMRLPHSISRSRSPIRRRPASAAAAFAWCAMPNGRSKASPSSPAVRAAAAPSPFRAMCAASRLQSRHGNQPWSAIVGPAERLAGTGFPLSRASAAPCRCGVRSGRPGLHGRGRRALARTPTRHAVELAATLTLIRSRGVTGFYAGETARALVAGARGRAVPQPRRSGRRPAGTAPAQSFPRPPARSPPSEALGAGVFAAALWRDIEKASPAELAQRAPHRRRAWRRKRRARFRIDGFRDRRRAGGRSPAPSR